jgi:hypothetical protein
LDWNALVAVGTLVLAIATFTAVYQGRKQLQMLSRQLNLQTGQQVPHLFIKQVTFEEDIVKLDIENATNVPACWAGLETRFFLVRRQYYDAQRNGHEITWGEAVKLREKGQTVYGKYYLLALNEGPKLVHEGKEVKPETAISFFAPQGVSVYFPPKATVQVKTTPRFAVSFTEKDRRTWMGFEYGTLRDFLLKNNIDEVAVSMSLVCKNAGEMVFGQGYVASFVIRTVSDKSLADSSRNAQRFDFLPLSHQDYLSDGKWTTDEQYRNTYSTWHVFD